GAIAREDLAPSLERRRVETQAGPQEIELVVMSASNGLEFGDLVAQLGRLLQERRVIELLPLAGLLVVALARHELRAQGCDPELVAVIDLGQLTDLLLHRALATLAFDELLDLLAGRSSL